MKNKKLSKLINCRNIITISLLTFVNSSFADNTMNFNFSSQIPDGDYKNIVTTIVNPTRFQFMSSPSRNIGRIIPVGISVGGGVSYVNIPQSTTDSLNKYTDSANNFPSAIVIPRLIAKIDIPGGLDVAVNYATIPQSSIVLSGIAVQYSLFDPRLVPVSFALRGGYTRIQGFAPLDANSTNVEALLGAKLAILKPYVGVGNNWSNASTNITNQYVTLSKSLSWTETYGILGLQLSALLGLGVEAQISSSQTIYNAKLSIEI
ncbi:autotransporter outer membrane beta-barrel domain-containing protein [Silvanigrella aquatica]|uniref:Outer membrane protein beta-barrel domain-containing protein n=1 Tax=Silvanigrella aquatica TaxID=1915309 RepID=A0A1L4D2V9_9BACT|nr:autotransporter outer membrane beta-barrel domain-containing protein [Silvanigrella aquatica]APJ04536.1 hypothetical protein AXG55_11720 [Silvanigrella aquatica]